MQASKYRFGWKSGGGGGKKKDVVRSGESRGPEISLVLSGSQGPMPSSQSNCLPTGVLGTLTAGAPAAVAALSVVTLATAPTGAGAAESTVTATAVTRNEAAATAPARAAVARRIALTPGPPLPA